MKTNKIRLLENKVFRFFSENEKKFFILFFILFLLCNLFYYYKDSCNVILISNKLKEIRDILIYLCVIIFFILLLLRTTKLNINIIFKRVILFMSFIIFIINIMFITYTNFFNFNYSVVKEKIIEEEGKYIIVERFIDRGVFGTSLCTLKVRKINFLIQYEKLIECN